jgi:hypothetical protein
MLTADQLESEIRQGIPLATHMAFRISELTPCTIRVIGGAEENINVHGTAFAGSLYARALVSGEREVAVEYQGTLYAYCEPAGADGN